MSENTTQATSLDPRAFIATVDHARRRSDAETLLPFFQDVTGFDPVMWGSAIIGYGRYHYRYDSGREGDFLACGFSPRKASMSLYIMPGYQDYTQTLDRLGPHKMGKACLYISRLDRIDMDALADLIRTGLKDLAKLYPVFPK
ncbi:MAG: DUF1801 domain-containing protein [Pseudomonadota bacterium]